MRELADADRIRRLMHELGRTAQSSVRIYFTGGAGGLGLPRSPCTQGAPADHIELASPDDFIPVPAGWEDRSPFIAREGRAEFHHFDLYARALAKVERGHDQDLLDVREMLARGLVEGDRALEYFERLEPELYRYPALDPSAFRRAAEDAFQLPPR